MLASFVWSLALTLLACCVRSSSAQKEQVNFFKWIHPPQQIVEAGDEENTTNETWPLGSTVELSWRTSWPQILHLALLQRIHRNAPEEPWPYCNVTHDLTTDLDEEVQRYNWTVSFGETYFDLERSSTFFFYLEVSNYSGMWEATAQSKLFNITTVRPPGSSSPTTTLELAASTSSSAPTEAADLEPKGLGRLVGVVVVATLAGVAIIIGLAIWLWHRRWSGRMTRLKPGERIVGPNEGVLLDTLAPRRPPSPPVPPVVRSPTSPVTWFSPRQVTRMSPPVVMPSSPAVRSPRPVFHSMFPDP